MEKVYLSQSAEQTVGIGVEISKNIKPFCCLAFRGDLGAGKTCLISGIAKGLGFNGETSSPTFALVNEYRGGRLPLFHFDMYRISSWDELYSSGFFEYIEEGGVVAAEWSENIENALPDNTIYVVFEKTGDTSRKITVFKKGEVL